VSARDFPQFESDVTAPTLLSPNVSAIRESTTIAFSARARALRAAGRDVIDSGAGEPDLPTPPHIAEAGRRAIRGSTIGTRRADAEKR
jgi:aspartate aminotransferase